MKLHKVEKLMEFASEKKLVHFLQEDLSIPAASVEMALRHPEKNTSVLPMILWQYGLVTLEQLDLIFDWLETV